jgi:hypothetical protein
MMTEEKQLLLKDLCARLPYGVKVKYIYWDENKGCEYPVPMILDDINSDGYIRFHGDIEEGEGRGYILTYLPYLRPMESMTEEEEKEFIKFRWTTHDGKPRMYEWCDYANEHHFDYRGLIEKGLALEAPDGMYKID